MKNILITLFAVLWTTYSFGQEKSKIDESRVVSKIDSSYGNELALIQEFTVKVPIDSV